MKKENEKKQDEAFKKDRTQTKSSTNDKTVTRAWIRDAIQ